MIIVGIKASLNTKIENQTEEDFGIYGKDLIRDLIKKGQPQERFIRDLVGIYHIYTLKSVQGQKEKARNIKKIGPP